MSRDYPYVELPDSRQCPGMVSTERYQTAGNIQGKDTKQQTMSSDSPYVEVPDSRQCPGTILM